MKKVLIFTLLFILMFTITVFAVPTSIPQDVMTKYEQVKVDNATAILWTGGDGYIIDPMGHQWNGSALDVIAGAISGGYYTSDAGKTWSNADGWGDYTGTIIFSNYDVTWAYWGPNANTVFFSKPTALTLALGSIVPNVATTSRNILVVAVGIMAILMAVSLIPRVLYRV